MLIITAGSDSLFGNATGIMISTVECTMEDKKGRPIEKAKVSAPAGLPHY